MPRNNNNPQMRQFDKAVEDLIEMRLVNEIESDDGSEALALTPQGALFGHLLWQHQFQNSIGTSVAGIRSALVNYSSNEDVPVTTSGQSGRFARTKHYRNG